MSKLRSFYHIIAIMFCEPLKSHLKTTKKLYKHFQIISIFFLFIIRMEQLIWQKVQEKTRAEFQGQRTPF